MNELQAFSKQLFGAKYERIVRSLLTCVIVYSSLYAAEIRIEIAPFILYLTAAAFSAGIMWQTLNSSTSAEILTGLFMLPFENRKMTFSVTAAFSGYTFITRSMIVLSLLWSVSNWSFAEIALSILFAAAGCLITAAWFTMSNSEKIITAIIYSSAVLPAVLIAKEYSIIAIILVLSIMIALLILCNIDAYAFYKPQNTLLVQRNKSKSGNIIIYFIRYLITNKNYLINTAGLSLFAIFLPYMFGQFKEIDAMPMGFAILCLNTPICVLLSIDRDLEQAVRTLPKQLVHFCVRYCIFIFFINSLMIGIYLISWQIQYQSVSASGIYLALFFALQSAFLSVLLEWQFPLRNWNTENDLLHHPRKYIVPGIMLLLAGFIGIS